MDGCTHTQTHTHSYTHTQPHRRRADLHSLGCPGEWPAPRRTTFHRHTTRQEPALGGAWDDEEPSMGPRSPLLKKELHGPSPILWHPPSPNIQSTGHPFSQRIPDTRLAERGGTVSASLRGASRGYEEEEPDSPRSKPGDGRGTNRTRDSGLPKPALSSAARSSIRSAPGPCRGLRVPATPAPKGRRAQSHAAPLEGGARGSARGGPRLRPRCSLSA